MKTTYPCDFSNLNTLVLVCHCLLPLINVPLTFILIPNKCMTDNLVEEEGDAACDQREEDHDGGHAKAE